MQIGWFFCVAVSYAGMLKRVAVSLVTAMIASTTACHGSPPQRATRVGYTERESNDPTRSAWNGATDWTIPARIWYPATEALIVIGPPSLASTLGVRHARTGRPDRPTLLLDLLNRTQATDHPNSFFYSCDSSSNTYQSSTNCSRERR